MDCFKRSKRIAIMRSVRTRNTAPEETVAHILSAARLRPFRNVLTLPGRPDFFFPDERLVVFVHGCFWHGHKRCLKGKTLPKSNRRFWAKKICANRCRDSRVNRWYWRNDYRVVTVWECELTENKLPARFWRKLQCENDHTLSRG